MMKITAVTSGCTDELRQYIVQNPRTLIYSEPRFIELVSEHLEAKCGWLVSRRNGVIAGVLPFLIKEGPLGPVLNSLAYYGSNGGVIQLDTDDDSKSALVNAFYGMAADAKAVSATIISNPLERDWEFYEKHAAYDFKDERIGQVTHLPASPEKLLDTFEDPRPRNIRRAIKEGVVINKGTETYLDFLFQTQVDNLNAIGGKVKKHSFFKSIPRKLRSEDWAVFTASLHGELIAALLVLYFNKTVEYFTPAIVESYRNTQALSLVIFKAMQDAIQKGYSNWNWGGTWLDQNGVYNFKKRWGTSDYKYFYYTRVFNQNLKLCNPEDISTQYPGFYLIPFKKLTKK